jgi:hypothetical protein
MVRPDRDYSGDPPFPLNVVVAMVRSVRAGIKWLWPKLGDGRKSPR